MSNDENPILKTECTNYARILPTFKKKFGYSTKNVYKLVKAQDKIVMDYPADSLISCNFFYEAPTSFFTEETNESFVVVVKNKFDFSYDSEDKRFIKTPIESGDGLYKNSFKLI